MRNCRPRGERSHSDLMLGPWSRQHDGRVQSGVIATAADHVFGEVVFLRRPPGWWAVTTELSVDFLGPLPPESALHVSAGMTRLEQRSGFAHGTVTDRQGGVVAFGSARAQFVRPHRDVPLDVEASPAMAAADPVATTFEEHLQIAWTRACDGMHLRMDDPSGWVNEFGILHGGIWACMAEVAASRVIAERNPDLTTSRLHTTYLRSGVPGAPVVVSARVHHVGSRLAAAKCSGARPTARCARCQR
jgi:uncharacterized protein (TIGR00369 family)